MLRFLLVLVTCALPVYSMASTYHADYRVSDQLEITSKTGFRLFPYQRGHASAATVDSRLARYEIWRLQIGDLFKIAQKPTRTKFHNSQKPGLYYFRSRPYPSQFVPSRANRVLTSGQDNIPLVPIASSYVFMLTMIIAAVILQQKNNIRSAASYTRFLLGFNKVRKL